MRDDIRRFFSNPILVKHVRSRLRPQSALSAVAVVIMLNLCLAFAGYQLDWYQHGYVAGGIMAMQIVILGIMGSAQVNASVNGARASGVLDFHRVTPMTPSELMFGFFLGAPIREYALFASTIPFTIFCMAFGIPTFLGFLQLILLVLSTAWILHAISMLSALISNSKNPSGNAVGMIVFLLFFFAYIVLGATQSVYAVESEFRLRFFGISLPWLPVILLYELPMLFFLLLAVTRKMESQRMHPLSKPQAIAALLTFSTLIVGGIWRQENYQYFQLATLYLLVVPSLLLTAMTVSSQAEYIKGLHRAQKQGRPRLPWWNDLSVSVPGLTILPAIVLVAGTVAETIATGTPDPHFGAPGSANAYSLALAAAVLTVAYHAFGLQYFHLRFGRRASVYFGLFLFVAWLLPILSGWILAASDGGINSERMAAPIFALSPVAGIGMIYAIQREFAFAVQAAALISILLFVFGFAHLLVGARRRIIKGFVASLAERPAPMIGPDLDGVSKSILIVRPGEVVS